MALDNHVRRGHPIIFGIQLIVVFIELILTGLLASHYNNGDFNIPVGDGLFVSIGGASRAKFLLFVSIWSFVFFAFYLVGTLFAASNFLFSIASHTVFLAITWIFWLAGAAAWSAFLGGFNCDNDDGGLIPHCSQLVATEAFAWIEWILITFCLVIIVVIGGRAARSGSGFGGAISEA